MANEIPAFDGGFPRNVAGVMIHGEIIAHGEASSGKNAKVKASQMARKKLEGIAPYEYRQIYHCNCREKGTEEKAGEETIAAVGTAI